MNSTTTKSSAEPTVEPSSIFIRFILDQLNVARLRVLLAVNEVEATAAALRVGLISAEDALLHMHSLGLSLIEASSRSKRR